MKIMKSLSLVLLVASALMLTACNSGDSFETDSNITVYTRDTTSGTRAGFMGGIGFSEAESSDDVLVEGFVIKDNTGIMTSMATDEYGIGYVSLASLTDDIKGLSFEGVEPTVDNVINNTYGLKRPFNWMVRQSGDFPNETVEDLVEAFIAFLETTDAADIINNAGAVALPATQTWDDIKADYPVTNQDNSGVTVRFGGSDSIQKVAEALTQAFVAKAGNFVADHDHTGSGDAYKRVVGDQKDESVGKDVGFASRPFKDSELEVGGVALNSELYGQLAWDAIVAIVHVNNPLSNVTADDLKKIYNGSYLKWSDLISE
ncbi:MAG: substrate-binding domain-containing protein [Acholeplasmataceae bacterium]|nr:substrate-binding domain-containing protein [Acholeplasmataceae bacterium]